jgi:predicted membrane protein
LTLEELKDYLTILFLIIFSFMGVFLTIFLLVLFRQINKIKHQFETANHRIESFKESMKTVNKSMDLFRNIFSKSKKNSKN